MRTSPAAEDVLWVDRPSHVPNLGVYALCVLLCWLVVPAFYGLWRYLQVQTTRYTLTTERLQLRRGVLNKQTSTLELYRVKDITLKEPLYLRPFGLADIVMNTSDLSDPVQVLSGVGNAEALVALLRQQVERMRMGRVREMDVN